MKRVVDAAFQRVFSHLFVYNILFEDSEVDERFLGIDGSSRVLGISGAGCRIAGHLSQQPEHVDAVDINRHHLALTALKVQAAQKLRSYDEFYDLFGRSRPDAGPIVRKLAGGLPALLQGHLKRHRAMFSRDLFTNGLTAKLLRVLQRLAGVDEGWLRRLTCLDVNARKQLVVETFRPVLTAQMSDAAQKRLFEAVIRAGRDGGVLQYRTVESTSLVERHGLADRLQPMVPETEMATALDRTRQFRGVRYYRIVN